MQAAAESASLIFPLTASVSLLMAVLVIMTGRWHGGLTSDSSIGIQKVHQGNTPRIGGVGILAGYIAAAFLITESIHSSRLLVWDLLVAASPALMFGLAEDLTKRVGTKERLLATMISGVVAWYLTGYALFRVDIPGVDALLALTPIAVLFTAFAIGGVANAINMIDGFNGLASGTVMICLAAMGFMAWQVGDDQVFLLVLIISATTLGFFLVNFPYGRLFLGDGGAYMLGFLTAWIAVMLSARHPDQISPWAPLLACAYPILEAVFSMGRRIMRGLAMDQPDRTHLHSLVYRRVVPRFFKGPNKALRNAAVSPFMWAFASIPALLSIVLKSSTVACILGLIATALLYAYIYARLSKFRWAHPGLRFRRGPPPAN